MKTKFNFKKNIFSNTYTIYEVDREIGFIKKNYFSQRTLAELNGKKFLYNEKGFLNKETEILDSENKTVGEIKYSSWSNKAFLKLFENKLSWQYENMWNTKWKIKNTNGNYIEFNSNGNIKADQINDNEFEILSGLFVYNRYQKAMIVVMIVIFTPIFLTNIFKLIN
ncbi:hypothetical protein D3C87_837120 [compost metagenome]